MIKFYFSERFVRIVQIRPGSSEVEQSGKEELQTDAGSTPVPVTKSLS